MTINFELPVMLRIFVLFGILAGACFWVYFQSFFAGISFIFLSCMIFMVLSILVSGIIMIVSLVPLLLCPEP